MEVWGGPLGGVSNNTPFSVRMTGEARHEARSGKEAHPYSLLGRLIAPLSPPAERRSSYVTSLAFAALMQLPLLAASPDSYVEARRQTEQSGQPLVVMVGAEWCPACQTMKNSVLPQVRQHGLLGKVAFALVDLDRESSVGQNLIGAGPIPQLIMYRKTGTGWLRKKLIGSQSVETVERFIQDGVALNARQTPPAAQPASEPGAPAVRTVSSSTTAP
jgi:hypothetical protein